MKKRIVICAMVGLAVIALAAAAAQRTAGPQQGYETITYEVDTERNTISFYGKPPYKITGYEVELAPIVKPLNEEADDGAYSFAFTDTGYCFLKLYYETSPQDRAYTRYDLTLSDSDILSIRTEGKDAPDVYVLDV